MKTNRILLIAALFLSLLLFGCGDTDDANVSGDLPGSGDGVVVDPPVDDTPTDEAAPVSAIFLTADSSAIGTTESANLTVTLYNASGLLIGGSKEVTFTLDNPAVGWISSPLAVTNGVGFQAFNARDIPGTVIITATVDGKTATQTIQVSDEVTADQVTLVATPAGLSVGGTSTVSATVLDEDGQPMPNGTLVNFSVDDATLGSIVSSATVANGLGVATATFSASVVNVGIATVTANSGSAANSVNIEVVGASAASGSIEFSTAVPQIVSLRGSGGQETSEIKFLVKDSNGDPITTSETVNLVLSGPNGGEYLGSTAGVSVLDVSTVNGFATVILHSGTIPGTATITATVVGTSLSTSSGVISIGGGVISAGHFSLSTTRFNIEGRNIAGVEAEITARVADRYGNYNILPGSSVSFFTECGAIDTGLDVGLSEDGEGSVIFRTQTPDPQDVTVDALATCGYRCLEENNFIADFDSAFGTDIASGSNNPRDGLCTIVALVEGEEEFTDNNANGLYDLGEPFTDTYDDIHLDMDDDEFDLAPPYSLGLPYDPAFEDLIADRNGNAAFDGLNNVWDGNKRIGKTINLLYTGAPVLTLSDLTFSVPDSGSQTILFAVHDVNYNRPIGGSKVSVTVDGGGALSGNESWEFNDSNGLGTPILSVTISDSALLDPDPPALVTLEFTIEWPGETGSITTVYSISGTVN